MLYRSTTSRSQPGRGDTRGANRENERLPMLPIGTIQEELDICFTELKCVEGQFPFEAHGWREEGIPSAMVARFCERQSAQDNPTWCSIFHNAQKIDQYDPPDAKDTSASVVFGA